MKLGGLTRNSELCFWCLMITISLVTYLSYNGSRKMTNVGKDMNQMEFTYIVGGKVNQYSNYRKKYRGQWYSKLQIDWRIYGSSNPISGYISKGIKISMLKRKQFSHIPSSTVQNSQDMESIYLSIIRQVKNKITYPKTHTYTQHNPIRRWKRRKSHGLE